jgi:hypothetical protein
LPLVARIDDPNIAATLAQKVDTAKAWMGDKATFGARSKAEFASFKGIQILARKDLASDRVELKYHFAFGKRQETKIVEMVKIDGAWKSGQTRAHEPSWDAGSQGEPQPELQNVDVTRRLDRSEVVRPSRNFRQSNSASRAAQQVCP